MSLMASPSCFRPQVDEPHGLELAQHHLVELLDLLGLGLELAVDVAETALHVLEVFLELFLLESVLGLEDEATLLCASDGSFDGLALDLEDAREELRFMGAPRFELPFHVMGEVVGLIFDVGPKRREILRRRGAQALPNGGRNAVEARRRLEESVEHVEGFAIVSIGEGLEVALS